MIKREDGFAPTEWSGGMKDANDVVVGRHDGKDFTVAEYYSLDKYIRFILDRYGDDNPVPGKLFTPKCYQDFCKNPQ